MRVVSLCRSSNKLLLASTLIAVSLGGMPLALAVVKQVQEIKLKSQNVDRAFQPRRLALLVGVNEFADERFRALNYALKDVDDFQGFLTAHNARTQDEVIILKGEQATSSAVLKALDELEKRNTSENDIVLVYFSTHGTLAFADSRQLSRYAVMQDSQFDRVDQTALSIDFLQNRLGRLLSKRKAMILALCHSGTGKSQLPSDIQSQISSMKGEFFAQPIHEVSSAMMVLSASGWGQPAREDKLLSNDIYTHFLIDGLKNHDSNRDGAVSLFEAHEYARSRTYDFTRGQQTPSALINLEGSDPIILNGVIKRRGQPLVFADSDRFRDLQLQIDGETKGSLWQPRSVRSGPVRLALVDPKDPGTPLIDHQVYLQENKSYSVSTLMARQPGYAMEVLAYQLPVSLNSQDHRLGGIAPGLSLRASEILGSRFDAQIAYFHSTHRSETKVDFDNAAVVTTTTIIRLRNGYSFYPARKLSLNLNAGVEALTIEREIDNPSLEHPQQTASLIYPTLGSDLRWLDVFKTLYVGAGINTFPSRNLLVRMDDEPRALNWLSASLMTGLIF